MKGKQIWKENKIDQKRTQKELRKNSFLEKERKKK